MSEPIELQPHDMAKSAATSDSLDERRSRRFALVFLACFVTLCCGVASLNLIVNPLGQYPTRYFPPVVQMSRQEKLELMQSQDHRFEGLILGSSRVLKLEPAYLESQTGVSFFNAGVNYAGPEDHLAIVRFLLEQSEQRIQVVVVGIDPCSFADSGTVDARLLRQPELAQQLPDFLKWQERLQPWTELLAYGQTKQSVRSLYHFATDAREAERVESYLNNGQIVYHQREAEIEKGVYDLEGAIAFNQQEYLAKYARFTSLCTRRQACFETLVETCRGRGIELIVFMTPMHPKLVEFLDQRTNYRQRRTEVHQFLSDHSREHGYTVHDFSEIRHFDGDPNQFVDGIHPLESNTRLMIDRLCQHAETHSSLPESAERARQRASHSTSNSINDHTMSPARMDFLHAVQ